MNAVQVKTWPVLDPDLSLIGRARGYVCRRCGKTRIFGLVPLVYANERARIHAIRCAAQEHVEETRIETRRADDPGVLVHLKTTVTRSRTIGTGGSNVSP